jgi:hypothetical protein
MVKLCFHGSHPESVDDLRLGSKGGTIQNILEEGRHRWWVMERPMHFHD